MLIGFPPRFTLKRLGKPLNMTKFKLSSLLSLRFKVCKFFRLLKTLILNEINWFPLKSIICKLFGLYAYTSILKAFVPKIDNLLFCTVKDCKFIKPLNISDPNEISMFDSRRIVCNLLRPLKMLGFKFFNWLYCSSNVCKFPKLLNKPEERVVSLLLANL